MLTRSDPFEFANLNDQRYRQIAGNKTEKFWEMHHQSSQFLSEDVKELLVDMMNLEQYARPTLEEIKAHPWM